jgi:hypothetical protein
LKLCGKRIHQKNSKDQANPLVFVEKQLHLFSLVMGNLALDVETPIHG